MFSEFHICFSLNIWCKVTVRIQNFLNITLCSLKLSALILYNEILKLNKTYANLKETLFSAEELLLLNSLLQVLIMIIKLADKLV